MECVLHSLKRKYIICNKFLLNAVKSDKKYKLDFLIYNLHYEHLYKIELSIKSFFSNFPKFYIRVPPFASKCPLFALEICGNAKYKR